MQSSSSGPGPETSCGYHNSVRMVENRDPQWTLFAHSACWKLQRTADRFLVQGDQSWKDDLLPYWPLTS